MRKVLLFIVMAISVLACESDEITKKQAIDSDIQIVPLELLTTDSAILALLCTTEKVYPCANYGISNAISFSEYVRSITFTEVPEIDLCLTALEPAKATIGLGGIVEEGEYEISLNNGSVKNKGTLTLTATEIILDLESENGIEILRKITKRIPQHTYWGTVGYAVDSITEKATEFLNELKNINGVNAFNQQMPGIYSYYEINQNGEIEPGSPSGHHFTKYFIFQYNGDNEEEFKNQLELLSTLYNEDLNINLQNSKGQSIYNWD